LPAVSPAPMSNNLSPQTTLPPPPVSSPTPVSSSSSVDPSLPTVAPPPSLGSGR
jgi:hypothetical protein